MNDNNAPGRDLGESREGPDGIIPKLGMSAAAFACLLVAASVEHPSPDLLHATRIFAVAIPLAIAGVYVMAIRRDIKEKGLKAVLYFLYTLIGGIGNLGCGLGVYLVFRHVSSVAARRFLITSLACFIAMFLLGMAVGGIDRRQSRRARE